MLWISALIIAFLLWFVLWGRNWLFKQPWARTFMERIEPIEIALYKKSQMILTGRLLQLGSGIVAFYDTFAMMFSGLDITPITTRMFSFVPDDLRPLAICALFGLVGLLINSLRAKVTKPLELVAVPEATAPAAVQQAVVKVEAANALAVAVVTEAKARGSI